MGTSLANLHILGGNLEQIKRLIPNAVTGVWSSDCISVFSPDFMPGLVDKKARALSKKIAQPVLSVWIFDSDAVGLSIFQDGKGVASHVLNFEGYSKMGNIPLFCQTWQLSKEDEARIRTVWKKGDAEDQLNLMSALMGLPLYHDSEVLPDKPYQRDVGVVDQWIKDRPAPPRIKNQAKVELIQELPGFRYHRCSGQDCPFCVSAQPFDDPYAYDSYHLWKCQPDGTIREIWSTERFDAHFYVSDDRAICTDIQSGVVQYDSTGLLPEGFPVEGHILFLNDGKLLIDHPSTDMTYSLSCRQPDGKLLWRKDGLRNGADRELAWNDRELIREDHSGSTMRIVRVDLATGRELETLDSPIGLNVHQAIWHDGAWWITHDGHILKDGVWNGKGNYALTKLDGDFQKVAEVDLPSFSRDVFFDPCGKLIYVYIFQDQILGIETKDLTVRYTLKDKSYLAPLGFDDTFSEPRFWMQRDNSTVEAWDGLLTKPMSRHRLKGVIIGHHRDQENHSCIATWDEKKNIFRIYRLT